MKTVYKIFYLLLITGTFASCEEVIDVSLDTAPARLVIDASIDWVKGTDGSYQTIRLSTTTGYFNPVIPAVSGAVVTVENSNNDLFSFVEGTVPGLYECFDFIPEMGETYTLTVIHNGQTYTATERLIAVPEIDYIIQKEDGGFLRDQIEVEFFFQDPPGEDNSYLVGFKADYKNLPEYFVINDRFFQGNQMSGSYFDDDLEPGSVLDISLYGISEQYYNYMSILLGLASENGGPFQTPPATLRGNIVNQTSFDNFVFGYFRLSEVDQVTYVVE